MINKVKPMKVLIKNFKPIKIRNCLLLLTSINIIVLHTIKFNLLIKIKLKAIKTHKDQAFLIVGLL